MKIDVEIKGIEEAKKLLSSELTEKALTKTVWNTAQDAKKDVVTEMKQVFDRPTPWILKQIFVRGREYDPSGLSVLMGVDPFGSGPDILAPHIEGGGRPFKKSEARYFRGTYWVPASGARMNKYGNISGGQITQIISTLGRFPEIGYTANITPGSRQRNRKAREYFVVGWGNRGLHAGIWERYGGGRVRPILLFVKTVSYRARFKFFEVIKQSIARNLNHRFDQALKDVRTVR